MPTIDEIRDGFARKLDRAREEREERLREDLRQLQPLSPDLGGPVSAAEISTRIEQLQAAAAAVSKPRPNAPAFRQALVNLTNSDPLRDLDRDFLKLFNLPDYYPADKLAYPTEYCETLEEFFTPFLTSLNLSEVALRQQRDRMIAAAEEMAGKGGGIFGVNFPGQGCYLNGWLFGKLEGISPRDVMRRPEAFKNVLATAAHEKLGHGFLSVYSALGEVKTRLGLSLAQIAARFGVAPSDDPAARLRTEQSNLLFTVSQFLEEGWATWIEHYLEEKVIQKNPRPGHSLAKIVDAVQSMPAKLEGSDKISQSMLKAMGIIFGEEVPPMPHLHQAVVYLQKVGLELDDYFSGVINQPLRYALGELLCVQAAANLGEECLPYAALIAANITFDPSATSLTDLNSLVFGDPRLNPDVRLAAISRIKPDQPGNIRELAEKVNSELSLSIPPEIRK